MINEKCVKLIKSRIIPDSISRVLLNKFYPIIHIDHIRPISAYPALAKEILHPEFELKGPNEFDVTTLKRQFHPDQRRGLSVGSKDMYHHLITLDLLQYCVNLADILAIQVRGAKFFRRHFPEGILIAWASVVQSHGGGLYVPYLIERDNKMTIGWQLLIIGILPRIPILCHAKK